MTNFFCNPTNQLSMEPNFLQFSPKMSSSVATLPFFLPHKSSLLQKPRISLQNPVSVSIDPFEKTPFWGQTSSLQFGGGFCGDLRKTRVRFPQIPAAVKRRKEIPFDNVIQKDKKLKLVLKIRKILVSQPGRVMQLRDLGKYRRELGLQRRRRFIALLRKFPGVFEIEEEGSYSLKLKLTPEAERLYLEEMHIRNEMEELLVIKIRKLLMMSLEKRILIEKIGHLMNDFGLPTNFRETICKRYPQYYKVVRTERGPALELTHWDPELAVSYAELEAEENRARELAERDLIIDRPPKFNRVKLPKGLKLTKGEMKRIGQFRDLPYISPYSDFSALSPGSAEKEKHACGVVHEILSLTLEKRTLVDHLTHFREEFRFSQQVRGMLIRHPEMFYVSLKGDRNSVFLREAYRDSQLIEKNRLLIIKEKLRALVSVPRFPKRSAKTDSDVRKGINGEAQDGNKREEEEEEEEDWSNFDDLVSNEMGYSQGDEDDWPEEDDDVPPDFFDDDGNANVGPNRRAKQNEEKVRISVRPDGRPRERW